MDPLFSRRHHPNCGFPGVVMLHGTTLALVYPLLQQETDAGRAVVSLAGSTWIKGVDMELVPDDPAGRRSLEQRIVWAIRHVEKSGGSFALLLIRPSYYLKQHINRGVVVHPGLVRQFYDRLRPLVRRIDSIAQLSSQSIALLAEDVKGPRAAQALARRLHAMLDGPFPTRANRNNGIDSDMGIVLYPLHGVTPRDLIANAKTALVQTQRPGGTDMELYRPPGVSVSATDIGFSYPELMAAVRLDELVLHYQPQVRLPDQSVCGVEALLRWHHPSHGLLYPQQFLPSAQRHGALLPMEAWVLRQACMHFASWPRRITAGMHLNVNISVSLLCDAAFPHLLDAVIGESGLAPVQLRLEINAQDLAMQAAGWPSCVLSIRKRGMGIILDHVDDPALVPKLLRLLEPQIIKIDMAAFAGEEPAVIHGVIADLGDWASQYGARIMAQGVERVSQLDYLLDSAFIQGQGTFFYPPLPAMAISTMRN